MAKAIDRNPSSRQATQHVRRIYSGLYPRMTIEEVRAEFARIVEPMIRKRLERETKSASDGGGRGPKDPQDTDKAESKEDPPIGTEGDEHEGESPQSGS